MSLGTYLVKKTPDMHFHFHFGHLADASIQSDLQRLIHTNGGVNHARRQPARQEQLRLSVLLRDTSTLGGAGDREAQTYTHTKYIM